MYVDVHTYVYKNFADMYVIQVDIIILISKTKHSMCILCNDTMIITILSVTDSTTVYEIGEEQKPNLPSAKKSWPKIIHTVFSVGGSKTKDVCKQLTWNIYVQSAKDFAPHK